jgi:ElaB/YqjD/DUF883 family membrane-anchored ribosome-binding protein
MKNPRLYPQPGSEAGRAVTAKSTSSDLRQKAGDVASQVTDSVQEVAEEAKRSASSLATEANQSIKGFLNNQITAGAELVGNVADSARAAASTLDQSAPQVAGLVRNAVERIEGLAKDLRSQSVDDLVRITSDYARRQPMVLFGAAAAVGFIAFRVFKSTAPERPPTNRDLSPEHTPPIAPHVGQAHGI